MAAKKEKPWILTREINEYDQDGEYFVAVFFTKPTLEELKLMLGLENKVIIHILNGGGRRKTENEWFHLRQVIPGHWDEIYQSLNK
jgi:hypothetical protein